MSGMNVIRAAVAALHRVQEVLVLASQYPSQVWYEVQVRALMDSTITLVRESCGSDAEVAKLLKLLEMAGYENPEDGSLTHRVVMTRQRVIEEQVVTKASAPDTAEALAAAQHLLEGGLVRWQYKRTVSSSTPDVVVTEE